MIKDHKHQNKNQKQSKKQNQQDQVQDYSLCLKISRDGGDV